ncbi:MAG: hypothetical protein GX593_01890 [Actinomycetales bacterium]|nr:hypothetical protein [Actinomycetales bacterium]
MFILTVDQQGSTRRGDRVSELLELLAARGLTAPAPGFVRGFERTVGDEVQAVLDSPDRVIEVALALLREGGWSVGIGVGPDHEPLPASSREASGPAFVHAREAVERAKSKATAVPLAVEGEALERAAEAEAVLRLLGAVVARRTDAGWAAVDRLARGAQTQKDVARELGITEQAVSQRLRTAMWAEESAVHPLAARLLTEAEGTTP